MKTVISMPLESLMQMLLAVNFFLNGEKLELKDLTIYEDEQQLYEQEMGKEQTEQRYNEDLLEAVP